MGGRLAPNKIHACKAFDSLDSFEDGFEKKELNWDKKKYVDIYALKERDWQKKNKGEWFASLGKKISHLLDFFCVF